jgi:ATP-dependent RNA helicase SUPV3L1/SUV3
MGKKNKKNSKINQRIRKYFGDDPFDIGIERVSTETLSELVHAIGIYDVVHSKKTLLKTIRMLWSEADSGIRQDMLDFFSANGEIFPSDKVKKVAPDRENKIETLLQELDINSKEKSLLHDAFIDMRSKKITISKIEAKLRHIRFEEKKSILEKALDGIFDIDDSLEFNASLKFKIFTQHFHKILTLNTKPYSYEYIEENSIEKIIEKISQDKEIVIKHKQDSIDKFISSLHSPHEYLTDAEIESALRSTPPKTKVDFPLLKPSILKSIIGMSLDIFDVTMHDEEVLVRVHENCKLPYSKITQPYILELHIELNKLLENIWNAEELNFYDILDSTKKEYEDNFLLELQNLTKSCDNYAKLLHFTQEELYAKVYEYLLDLLPNTLQITSKIIKKTTRIFIFNIQSQLLKQQRHTLLARTIRDFKNLFPMARDMKRKLTLHIGPTNSGKTYQAMQKLQEADTGYYLAPLRLLALEGYETLKDKGIESSLITGEEQILDDEATHISSTIEMLNFEVDVDVCVIDEVQMIDDRDRGWAWANAIIGAPAKEIIMTGSSNSKEAIVALAEYLGEELEIIEFKRKNPLSLLPYATNEKSVKRETAIIAFSRRDVLRLKQSFSKLFSVSVVYGNLSPEVRREEARRFRDGETEILIATDAIAMGMNLPIKTILFSKAEKFDGISQRNLLPSEIHQISGRAGRYGLNEEGFVGALNQETLKIVKKNFYKDAHKIKIPFKVMANLEHIKLVGNILEENSLVEILKFFVENMKFNGPFHASNLDDMLEAAKIVDEFELDITTKYHLSCAPLTLKSPYIISAYEEYILALEKKIPVHYTAPILIGKFAQTSDDLLRAEDMVKEISLYLWLSYRFKDYFVDEKKARISRGILNKYIEQTLQQSQLASRCKMCGATLPINTKYAICQNCFKKHYTGKQAPRRKRARR